MITVVLRLATYLTLLNIGLVPLVTAASYRFRLTNNEILFTATLEDRHIETYWMDLAHRLIFRPTNRKFVETQPIWSPDGTQIAYISSYDKDNQIGRTIYIQNLLTMHVRRLLDDPAAEYSPAWSPDGRFIAYGTSRFDGSPELMLTNVETGVTRRLTNNKYADNHPTWSPDGRSIAFAADLNTRGNLDIAILNVQTGEVQPIIATADQEYNPSWSPDGHYILYVADRLEHGIFIWDIQTARSRLIYPSAPLGPDAPDWSPDGRYIIFADTVTDGRSSLFRIEVSACLQMLSTCLPQRLTFAVGTYSVPRWRPTPP